MGERYKVQYLGQSRVGLEEGIQAVDLGNISTYFVTLPVMGNDHHFMAKVEPGIFITGGSARATALREICNIPERDIIAPSDTDWITLGNRRIHMKYECLKDTTRKIPLNPNTIETLSTYCDETDFGVDGLVVGRFNQNDTPNIYLTPGAYKSYGEKYVDFSPNYKGVERNDYGQAVRIINDKVALRTMLLGLRLKKYGFSNRVDNSLIKESLERNWTRLLEDGIVCDYVSRAKYDGLLNEYLKALEIFGFTIPNGILQLVNSHTRSEVVDEVHKIQLARRMRRV